MSVKGSKGGIYSIGLARTVIYWVSRIQGTLRARLSRPMGNTLPYLRAQQKLELSDASYPR